MFVLFIRPTKGENIDKVNNNMCYYFKYEVEYIIFYKQMEDS
jgi:hypothetical protein